MKLIKYVSLAIVAFCASCSTDDTQNTSNELDGLTLVKEIVNDTHIVELYTATGTFTQGYNPISIRIKDKSTGQFKPDAQISWLPIMHMASMEHSCPYSSIERTTGKETLSNGFIVFQMASNATEYWTLTVNYTLDGQAYSATDQIDVSPSVKRRVVSFTGTDGSKYVVALIEPRNPSVGLNAMTAGIYKMESMMNYSSVEDFTVKIDPRMPAMGNHGSPNNVDLTQLDDRYIGSISLTMTGYWKINLQIVNQNGEVIKGEAVTDTNPASSIFFEIEF